MKKDLLQQELAPLKARIEESRARLLELRGEIRTVEAELETFSTDRMRFDALREACNLLDRLEQLDAGALFWGESPEVKDPAGHMERLKSRVAVFDEKIRVILDRQGNLKMQANERLDELDYLHDQVEDAYDRDERRESEFAIVRELSEVPHASLMPWSSSDPSDRRFRRTQFMAMLLSLILAIVIHQVVLPKVARPVVAQVPERLAMMVRQERVKPLPPKKAVEEKKEAKKEEKPGEKKAAKNEVKQQAPPVHREDAAPVARPKADPVEQTAAPKRSQNTGVLAFRESFKDLLDESATPKLGTEARVSSANQSGRALAGRNLVSIQGGGGSGPSGSGGIGTAALGRNGGSGGIGNAAVGRGGVGGGNSSRVGRGGDGFAQVKSAITSGTGVKDAKPVSASARPARTDEEIQLLFDRYKAALYRIYNTELRKDPTLRGKMVLKIAIEPSGVVSACSVESCNMNAPEFSEKIVERVKKINFGPKDGVPRTTILYPIDFLPAR
ncbi:AgmX/PglI C-terminal domain-containing protein [Geomonas sp.]|uniref:AgmX/PglI C-terminal domain-containing protein n=1 Tax=Geomonas sp. TaxID=2651584 RepID=UPI002B45E8A2|nr:AgmX/PglI C-terminal domain-containing protein [Geomonas sp.]HJV36737.1 AgmX/PglI C-terminal domain-containing protein [Geomonas sp.]